MITTITFTTITICLMALAQLARNQQEKQLALQPIPVRKQR